MKKSDKIEIRGARVNNLKNIDIDIQKNKLTVITGLSGSGKSSLAFDTIYAEGQRRYVESLSAYARQFMGRLRKPDVDRISGLSPAIAIEQRTNSSNPRSTVGTTTEIYEYLKLLFSRVGHTFSPISGVEVKSHKVGDVVDFIFSQINNAVYILSPVILPEGRTLKEHLEILLQQGFNRLIVNNKIIRIEDCLKENITENTDNIRIFFQQIKSLYQRRIFLLSNSNSWDIIICYDIAGINNFNSVLGNNNLPRTLHHSQVMYRAHRGLSCENGCPR